MLVNFNPAVSVGFRANEGTDFQTLLNRPGAYAKPDASDQASTQQPAEKKKSSIGKKVLWTVVGLAALAAVLVALPKIASRTFEIKEVGELTGAKKYLQKAANGIRKFSDSVLNLFKKSKLDNLVDDLADEIPKA